MRCYGTILPSVSLLHAGVLDKSAVHALGADLSQRAEVCKLRDSTVPRQQSAEMELGTALQDQLRLGEARICGELGLDGRLVDFGRRQLAGLHTLAEVSRRLHQVVPSTAQRQHANGDGCLAGRLDGRKLHTGSSLRCGTCAAPRYARRWHHTRAYHAGAGLADSAQLIAQSVEASIATVDQAAAAAAVAAGKRIAYRYETYTSRGEPSDERRKLLYVRLCASADDDSDV